MRFPRTRRARPKLPQERQHADKFAVAIHDADGMCGYMPVREKHDALETSLYVAAKAAADAFNRQAKRYAMLVRASIVGPGVRHVRGVDEPHTDVYLGTCHDEEGFEALAEPFLRKHPDGHVVEA
ncbi:MAG TPA: hypothetical protein VG826_29510 [Pirellulales bacterium]|nr:hypothetical protein [Pirellulales bacterium]